MALGLVSAMIITLFTGCGKTPSKYLMDIDYSDYITLCDYKGIKATKVVFDITEEDVKEEIEYMLYDYVTYDEVKDRGVLEGDYANVEYVTTIDGEENEDYSSEEDEIFVGEGYTYPELEEALIGMEVGDTKEVEFVLTEDYAEEELIGKTAVMNVTLNGISVENLPEYNLEFVQENTEFDTIEAYEESVKESIKAYKEEEYQYVAVEELFTYVLENSEFDGYPEELYTKCEEYYNESNAYYASMYGMELEEFLEMFGIDEETKKEEIEYNVKYELVIGAIATEEGIDCTEKEINEFVDEVYADYGYESAEDFLKEYAAEEIGFDLIYQKVSDFLYENATFVEKSEEDYLAEEEAYYYDDEVEEEVESEEEEEALIDLQQSLQESIEEEWEYEETTEEDSVEESSEETTEASTVEATEE